MKLEKLIARLKDIQSRIHFQCLKEGFKREDDEDILFQIISLLQSTADRLPDIAKMMEGRSLFGGKVKEEMADEIKEVITPTFLKLEAKVKELKEALSDSASTNAEQAAELFECQQKNELMEAEKGELKDRIKNREEMIDSLEKAYLRLKDSYKSLQQKLNEAQEEIKALKEWGEEWKNSYQRVLEKLSTTEAELEKLKKSKLTLQEFRNIVCEYIPDIAEDSEQPEWSLKQLDELWEALTNGYWLYINRDKEIEKLQAELVDIKERAIEENIEKIANKYNYKNKRDSFYTHNRCVTRYPIPFKKHIIGLAQAISKEILGGERK